MPETLRVCHATYYIKPIKSDPSPPVFVVTMTVRITVICKCTQISLRAKNMFENRRKVHHFINHLNDEPRKCFPFIGCNLIWTGNLFAHACNISCSIGEVSGAFIKDMVANEVGISYIMDASKKIKQPVRLATNCNINAVWLDILLRACSVSSSP